MSQGNRLSGQENRIKQNKAPRIHRDLPLSFILIPLMLYVIASLFVISSARSGATISLFGSEVPFSAFTGVFSSLGNLCLILAVVFFRKPGFIAALALLLLQYPMLVHSVVVQHGVGALPGFFTNTLTLLTVFVIYRRNRRIDKFQESEMEILKNRQKFSQRLFEQTATALVNAVDAKDTYSHGHSLRVAEYSERIAAQMGMDAEECRKIYYAALLHDVGKIGIPISIINKKGRLTADEYDVIKEHPVKGNQILSSISEYPYLSIGARYHHERYDGKGYPDKLKGEDIPEIARIIAVADAYDAMSSNRSYRSALPQQLVREEIVKGAGTQFDPKVAKIMQHLIDMDTEYLMKERDMATELAGRSELNSVGYRSEISDGIHITAYPKTIRLKANTDGDPILILFDSLDARVHDEERAVRELNYYEYCEIRLDGAAVNRGARKIEKEVSRKPKREAGSEKKNVTAYRIEACRVKDHAQISIDDGTTVTKYIIALPDSTRFAYIALTGEKCRIWDVKVQQEETAVAEDAIPRIAELVTYIDREEGDIPNVQIDGYRTAATESILLGDGMQLSFHSMSLPTARLVWHCPYLILYGADDAKINGENYREFAMIRLDGENWEAENVATNKLIVNKQDDFSGWDYWKQENKKGIDVVVDFVRKGNTITVTSENLGVQIRNTTTILDGTQEVYAAISGDQCALTTIRIKRG